MGSSCTGIGRCEWVTCVTQIWNRYFKNSGRRDDDNDDDDDGDGDGEDDDGDNGCPHAEDDDDNDNGDDGDGVFPMPTTPTTTALHCVEKVEPIFLRHHHTAEMGSSHPEHC